MKNLIIFLTLLSSALLSEPVTTTSIESSDSLVRTITTTKDTVNDSIKTSIEIQSTPITKKDIDNFRKGNLFYKAGEYDSALVAYGDYINENGPSATIYYNMGNAAYRAGRNGEAILFYKRANIYAPEDNDILANIRFVESELVDDIAAPERSIISISLNYVHNLLSLNSQIYVLIALSLVILVLFYIALFKDSDYRMWTVYGISIMLLLFTVIATSAAIKVIRLEKIKHGVVLTQEVDAYSAPEGKTLLFTAHEGTSFEIRKSSGNWYYVLLSNGVSGWLNADSVGVVEKRRLNE